MKDSKQIGDELVGAEDERAVSPVIGVVLMVAITVILAAVIATYVLDIGSDQHAPATAGVTIADDPGVPGLQVTLTSLGGNTKEVTCVGSGVTESASAIGTTFNCTAGNNLVGVDTNGKETTIRTDIRA